MLFHVQVTTCRRIIGTMTLTGNFYCAHAEWLNSSHLLAYSFHIITVFQAFVGHFNLRKTTIARQEHVLIRYIALMLEMTERSIYYGRLVDGHRNVSQAFMIVDLAGYNLVSTGCLKCKIRIQQFARWYHSFVKLDWFWSQASHSFRTWSQFLKTITRDCFIVFFS